MHNINIFLTLPKKKLRSLSRISEPHINNEDDNYNTTDMNLRLLIFIVSAYWVRVRVLIKRGKDYGWLLYQKFGIKEIR